MFSGLSTLRKQEREQRAPSKKNKDLQEYLKVYSSEGATKKKKKKVKKKKSNPNSQQLRIIDEDVTGFTHTAALAASGEEDDDEDAPVIANADEVEVIKRQAERVDEAQPVKGPAISIHNPKGVDEKSYNTLPSGASSHHLGDVSPPRRSRHDSPDLSPPRRSRHDSPDLSPPRKSRHDSPDLSPPRKSRHDSPDLSPPRKSRHDSPDISPPRKSRHDSPDISPPRKSRHDSPDLSPPRKSKRDSRDLSPPRRSRHGSKDLSSPHRSNYKSRVDPQDSGHRHSKSTKSGMQQQLPEAANRKDAQDGRHQMADGSAAGVVSGSQLKVELNRKRERDRERWKAVGEGAMGLNAETVYREKKHGKRVSLQELEEEEARKKVKWERVEWSSGLAQQRKINKEREEMAKEASKPFARGWEDSELDSMLRDKTRFGDPMAHLVKRKTSNPEAKMVPVIDESNREMFAKSGFVVPQEVPAHSWIHRRVPAASNRYGIRPGRHWDGVNRSNGFENELVKFQNEKAARNQEALMWSMEDM